MTCKPIKTWNWNQQQKDTTRRTSYIRKKHGVIGKPIKSLGSSLSGKTHTQLIPNYNNNQIKKPIPEIWNSWEGRAVREAMWWVRVRGVRVSEAECMGESWGCSIFGWEFEDTECGLNNLFPGTRSENYCYLFLSVDGTE